MAHSSWFIEESILHAAKKNYCFQQRDDRSALAFQANRMIALSFAQSLRASLSG
ncbi:MAG: hypothetical protein F6K36_20270 [Symploca sp. SIO3C6]|uniref:Uncharacterized protein n=1 Tax=Symploca sp. SIO1C4 TaxID=2607765 RepID=A0A6B3NC16_9CYAN|nr:hypothetical protein [Symploca sp. SIO3C6]NER31096.1 hypothetical protein [Symploca sp. SIO1C4]NET06726.1 hypothetical protein [Symploca sp. SIO2B6]NET49894.1 hypothetical protein [Merismopedia sp. SIO2A8]